MLVEHRLLTTKAGITRFAFVALELLPRQVFDAQIDVILKIQHPVDINDGEIDESSEPEWTKAAIDGAITCTRILRARSLLGSESWQILIRKIRGSVIDTTPDAVFCAAAIALWKGLCPTIAAPPLRFDNGKLVLAT